MYYFQGEIEKINQLIEQYLHAVDDALKMLAFYAFS